MTTWATTSKASAPTWATTSKAQSEIIYLVSEALDFYLIGSAESEFLVTQDVVNWSSITKN